MAHRWRTAPPDTAQAKARKTKYRSTAHRAARAHWAPLVEAGLAQCRRCRATLRPGAWHVGHDDVNTARLVGPECIPCNLTAAARKGNAVARAKRRAATTTSGPGVSPFVRASR